MQHWPHRIKGEGHFLALLKKDGSPASDRKESGNARAVISEEAEAFLSGCRMDLDRDRIKEHKGRLILMPKELV